MLRQAWKAEDLDKCGALLAEMKMTLTELAFMPTAASASPTEQELLLAREVLEMGAQWSVKMEDVASFERYIAQLKTYYFDYAKLLPSSSYQYELLGLGLLCLLAQNRIAEFHTELERLDVAELQANVYLRHPMALEQYLMEGSYNKVHLAKDNVPAESYHFFMDVLVDTIREEIASGLERSYEALSPTAVASLLFMSSQPPEEVAAFASARGWTLSDGASYVFDVHGGNNSKVNAPEMIKRTLNYARELEQII